jgi:hypothetical protein
MGVLVWMVDGKHYASIRRTWRGVTGKPLTAEIAEGTEGKYWQLLKAFVA